MRRCVLLFVLAVACRRSETSPPPDGDGATPGNTGGGASSSGGATTPPPERCAGGMAWDGKPEGCAYEVDGCCYADAETACAAVKCARAACEILETYPAQVRCRYDAASERMP